MSHAINHLRIVKETCFELSIADNLQKEKLFIRIKSKFNLPNGSRFPKPPQLECITTTKSASPRERPVRFSPALKHGLAGSNPVWIQNKEKTQIKP